MNSDLRRQLQPRITELVRALRANGVRPPHIESEVDSRLNYRFPSNMPLAAQEKVRSELRVLICNEWAEQEKGDAMQRTGLSEEQLTRQFLEHLIDVEGKNPFHELPPELLEKLTRDYPDLAARAGGRGSPTVRSSNMSGSTSATTTPAPPSSTTAEAKTPKGALASSRTTRLDRATPDPGSVGARPDTTCTGTRLFFNYLAWFFPFCGGIAIAGHQNGFELTSLFVDTAHRFLMWIPFIVATASGCVGLGAAAVAAEEGALPMRGRPEDMANILPRSLRFFQYGINYPLHTPHRAYATAFFLAYFIPTYMLLALLVRHYSASTSPPVVTHSPLLLILATIAAPVVAAAVASLLEFPKWNPIPPELRDAYCSGCGVPKDLCDCGDTP